jgi:hypothetical protein
MKKTILAVPFFLVIVLPFGVAAMAADDEGFVPIFDGKTLQGWDGDPKFWKVEDGTITGETTPDNPTQGNTFIIWRGGKPADFELKAEYRMRNGNSGIQFRSFEVENAKWAIGGYQSDIDESGRYSGILYGERYRGILAQRGDKTVIGDDHKPKVVGKVGDSQELLAKIDLDGWNENHIIAQANHIVQKINGQVMVDVTDEDTQQRRGDGLIALQLHVGPPMKVQFRNIRLKVLKKENAAAAPAGSRKIVLIAGRKSHGYASHEHYAGCLLLAKGLEEGIPGVKTVVYKDGWPQEPDALQGADAIVIFSDGGGGHPINRHLDHVEELMKKGVGLACLHYAVEVPKGRPGDCLKNWTGGYFEVFWSVNPHWKGEFSEFPDHPICRGVKPFFMDDEWYYHMRFMENMEGVTPILTAVPPESTRQRGDGAHSGNPTVRARKGMPEHVAWARVRPDGGRGFGFTGGHWHWSWACDSFRTVVLNGIAWTAKIEIPEGGVPSKRPTLEQLEANQDYPQPNNFDKQRVLRLIEDWNR